MTTVDKRMTFYWEGERALHVIWTVLSGVPPRQINRGFLIFLDSLECDFMPEGG